ncbi:alkylation response protein AidB-like acyl-CoA dehydrogenase [Novosphingobium hassiacum]|uniref:Alkylation response protein AidB-like acyl-CoA dehydrogenase n=1 Tax=Novosphingobium hassiacum TaxID=173676 RepID=A0A7W6EWG5_9SPHN|nr:acyl-CoA dehydrogenase family protein [Novosphingobium hassiacum]MBB3860975.1 alkylation response protein AidB-like acyl-CoA dehydrogenase [Novosphingobium hassiacum]
MTDEDLITEVRDWLADNWEPVRFQDTHSNGPLIWRQMVHARGFAVPSWPTAFGGLGLTPDQSKLVETEFRKVRAPGSGQDRSQIGANLVMQYGTDQARTDLLEGLITGEFTYCLLYSEPGAGSDLAAVRTRADLADDHYVINGQKVWTSGAATATFGLLLARTDWDVPKHAGLSFLVCPMKQEGIEVRPLHQINGDSHFNEVFMDNVRVPAAYLLSTEGNGWKVMQKALAYERLIMGEGSAERARSKQSQDSRVDLVTLAKAHGRLGDASLRQEIAQAIAWRRLNEYNGQRAQAAVASGEASPLMSLGKLAMSRVLHNDTRIMREILGAQALFDDPSFADAQDMNYRSLHAYMNSIGGGTDQIQRNIIGERVLNLPREVEWDRDIPFRESQAVKPSGCSATNQMRIARQSG